MTDPRTLEPRLQAQATALYDLMLRDAEERDDGLLIFEGSITALAKQVGINAGSYGKLRKRLDSLGCISMLVRGTGYQPSQIVLHRSPADVEWKSGGRLTGSVDGAILRQELDEMRRRLGTLDLVAVVVSLTDANTKLEQRMREIELRLNRQEKLLKEGFAQTDAENT